MTAAFYRHTDRLPDGTGAGALVADDLRAGRLEQACPCGRWEAAGRHCTGCLRRTGPNDWYRNGDMERRIAVVGPARAAEKTRPKAQRGGRGRGPRNTQTPVNGTPDADGGDTGNPASSPTSPAVPESKPAASIPAGAAEAVPGQQEAPDPDPIVPPAVWVPASRKPSGCSSPQRKDRGMTDTAAETVQVEAIFSKADGSLPESRPVELYRRGDYVWMRGGPTGYESLPASADIDRGDWVACFGTPGSWPRCVVPAAEMARAFGELGLRP